MTDVVQSFDDLVRLVEIRDVILYEVSAKRRDGFDFSDVPAGGSGHQMRVIQDGNEERIRVRCRMDMSTDDGIYSIDAAAIFALLRPVRPTPDLVNEFARRIGIPSVYPYLRVELQMAARRLGLKAPILSLFKPDQHTMEMTPMAATPGRRPGNR